MILFFDTETTGLKPGRIIQLSYIMIDGKETVGKNFYFAVEYIDPSATAVHGLTVEKLAELSGGNTFSCSADEIYDDFKKADLIVAHNSRFDISFMIAEFSYLDRRFIYSEDLDTMRFFTPIIALPRQNHPGLKYPKLSEACEFFDIYPYDICRKGEEIFGERNISSHDARYDTVALILCFEEGRKKIKKLEEIALKYLQN
ncbi:MAG: 3'-5' exonuclease [Clostridia bacterium]|nr:3'-5' exonuclease [Clostridia bacterium]